MKIRSTPVKVGSPGTRRQRRSVAKENIQQPWRDVLHVLGSRTRSRGDDEVWLGAEGLLPSWAEFGLLRRGAGLCSIGRRRGYSRQVFLFFL